MIIRAITILSVFLLDLVAKTAVDTHPGLMHPTPDWTAQAILCPLIIASVFWCPLNTTESIPLAVVAGGALGNMIDSIDGYVRNPLTLNIWEGTLGYNPADLCITIGASGVLILIVRPIVQRMLVGATQNPAD